MAIFSAISTAIGGVFASIAGGSFASSIIGGFLIRTAAKITTNLLVGLLLREDRDEPQQPAFALKGSLQSGGAVPRAFPLGTSFTAGSLAYANTHTDAGGTPNAYWTVVIALSDLPVKGLAGMMVNGAYVTIDTETVTDKGWPIEEYNSGGTDHLWVKFYDGTQTSADPYLTGTVSSTQRPYQSTRVGTGVAYAIVTARINQSLFSGFPTFGFVLESVPLYNPAADTSVGGSGSQRWANPLTWGGAGDELPMVQLYNLLRGFYFGGQWLYGLQGVTSGRLPVASWITEIGKCSANVTGEDGDEPAYRSAGMLEVSSEIGGTVEALLIAASARLSEVGGIYKPLVALPTTTAASFTDDDIITTEPQTERPFPTISETINAITARYPEPTEGYNLKDAPALYNTTWEAEDGGRQLARAITLANVPYAAQVQRLLSAAAAQARRFRSHTHVLSHNFWGLEPLDRVEWTSARRGYTSKKFLVDTVMDLPNGDVLVELVEIDPADYSWTHADDFVPVTRTPATVVRPTAVALPGFAVSAVSIKDASDTPRRPGILLEWTAADIEDATAVEWQVRVAATDAALPGGSTVNVTSGSVIIEAGLLGGVQYEVRARAVGSREFSWTAWTSVTTTDTLLSTPDIAPEGVDRTNIKSGAVSAQFLATTVVSVTVAPGAAPMGGYFSPASARAAGFFPAQFSSLGSVVIPIDADDNEAPEMLRLTCSLERSITYNLTATTPAWQLVSWWLYIRIMNGATEVAAGGTPYFENEISNGYITFIGNTFTKATFNNLEKGVDYVAGDDLTVEFYFYRYSSYSPYQPGVDVTKLNVEGLELFR